MVGNINVAVDRSLVPVRKVAVGGLAGAFTTIVIYIINTYLPAGNPPVPQDVAAAVTTAITFLMSYIIPAA